MSISAVVRCVSTVANNISHICRFLFEHISGMLKGTNKESEVARCDKSVQSQMCYEDLVQLVEHHFGKLHEEHYLNKIIFKAQWNKLTADINYLKDHVAQCVVNMEMLSTRIKPLGDDVSSLKCKMDELSKQTCHFNNQISIHNIPPPPPLPPSGISASVTKSKSCLENKQVFRDNIPRPVITVESLRQVKLKKTSKPVKLDRIYINQQETEDLSKKITVTTQKMIFKKRHRSAENSESKSKPAPLSKRPLTRH